MLNSDTPAQLGGFGLFWSCMIIGNSADLGWPDLSNSCNNSMYGFMFCCGINIFNQRAREREREGGKKDKVVFVFFLVFGVRCCNT